MLPRLAVLLMSAVLFNGTSSHVDLDPGFLQCRECFFKGSPPQSLPDVGLEQRCHQHLTGRPFASLYSTNCQSTVFTALHLSLNNGWGRGEQSKVAHEDINGDFHVVIPALYRETTNETPLSSPFLQWDSLTAALIRNTVIPKCSEMSGDIYVQTGVGGFNECEGKVMWSALCCAASDGYSSFSFGLVKEGDVKVLSIKALEEQIGITGLFSEGYGEMGHQIEEELASFLETQINSIKTHNTDAQSEERIDKHDTQEAVTSESRNEEVISESSESLFISDIQESTNETESSESALLYILSTTVSLLYAPFSPIVNRAINLPFQLTYVLQEDLAVMASVPGDSYTLVNNLGSGVSSGVSCVLNTLYQTGETTVCTTYACLSPLAGSLALAFQDGFMGMGTLALDVLGILTGTVGNGFKIIRMLFGLVLGDMVDYLCVVTSEMGHQVLTVGSGIGKLIWRSGKGVGHLLNFVVSIVYGMVENTVVNVQEAFQEESRQSSHLQTSELLTSEVVSE